MCIAIAQTEGAPQLSKKIFENCFERNKDGMGMAWIDWKARTPDRRIRTMRCSRNAAGKFDVGRFWDFYRRVQCHWGKTSPILIHFRWTTHGVTHPHNSHPFKIKSKLCMIHNGVLPMPTKNSKYTNFFTESQIVDYFSDTWHYANLYFPRFGYLQFHMDKFRKTTENFIGTGNKICFLDANAYTENTRKEFKTSPLIIYNEGQGNWHDGTWFSNTAWKSYEQTYGKYCKTYNCSNRVYVEGETQCWQCKHGWSESCDNACNTPSQGVSQQCKKKGCTTWTTSTKGYCSKHQKVENHSDVRFYSGGSFNGADYDKDKGNETTPEPQKESTVILDRKICKGHMCSSLLSRDNPSDWCPICESGKREVVSDAQGNSNGTTALGSV